MSLRPYPNLHDSQIEWLGEIPSHWEIVRLGALFQEVSEEGCDGLPILSVSIHQGVSDKELSEEELDRKVSRSEDTSKYIRVQPGDLVYNMMRAWQGGFGSVSVAGMVSPAYVVARPRKPLLTSYIEMLLRTPNAVEQMRRLSKGVTDFRLRLYWDEFKSLKVALPPIDEQKAMADYLDRETAKIDALVAEQERLIALLAEKRRAVISHAVTKGLDPNVPMKDSGIAWLGEVPAHWTVCSVKHMCDLITDGAHISPETDGGVIPFISTKDVGRNGIDFDSCLMTSTSSYEYMSKNGCQPKTGDVLFSKDGTIGRTTVVCTDRNFVVASSLIILSPIRHYLHHYLLNYLLSSSVVTGQVEAMVKGAGLPRLSITNLLRVIGVFAPIEEQVRISTRLDRETTKLDTLTTEAERAITLLKERRAALISAAVTGKIDVRGAVDAEEVAA